MNVKNCKRNFKKNDLPSNGPLERKKIHFRTHIMAEVTSKYVLKSLLASLLTQ